MRENKKNIEIFKKTLNKCEIGSHLHPWNTPPFSEKDSEFRFPYELDDHELSKKFQNMHNKIKDSLGITPKSYRAGRYGIDGRQIRLLEKYNYITDTSAVPFWKPFSKSYSKNKPYFPSYEDIYREGESRILEIPITILFNRNISKKLFFSMPSKAKGLLSRTGLLKLCWLRPSYSSFKEMKKVVDIGLKKKLPVLNMMFHSNELMKGTSPYTRTEKEQEGFYNRLVRIIYYIKRKNMESETLSEFAGGFTI